MTSCLAGTAGARPPAEEARGVPAFPGTRSLREASLFDVYWSRSMAPQARGVEGFSSFFGGAAPVPDPAVFFIGGCISMVGARGRPMIRLDSFKRSAATGNPCEARFLSWVNSSSRFHQKLSWSIIGLVG